MGKYIITEEELKRLEVMSLVSSGVLSLKRIYLILLDYFLRISGFCNFVVLS